jgi:ADP-ribose pyrophosphatase YjhB (NUDIX family)
MKYCSDCGSPRIVTTLPLGDIGIRHSCTKCGMVHYRNPNIVAACVATFQERVLLCRRAIEPFSQQWTIPGGYLELGETLEEAARRETAEETGVTLGELNLMAVYNLPTFGEVYIVYRGEVTEPLIHVGPESIEADFLQPSDIPWGSLAFPMVREALAYWVQMPEQPRCEIQTLDFFWGPEGAVRVRRPPRRAG